jgi:hypothetical protein
MELDLPAAGLHDRRGGRSLGGHRRERLAQRRPIHDHRFDD